MPDPTISPKWHKIQLYEADVIREFSVTVGMYENVRCLIGLQTFFLLDPSDKDLVKGYLTWNGKHLHEAFQGKFALKQRVAIQLQPLGKCSIPVQRLPLEGFIAPCLLCSYSFHFFLLIRKCCWFCFFFYPFSTEGQKPDLWCHWGFCHTNGKANAISAFCWLEYQSPKLQRSLRTPVVMRSPRL